MAGTATALIATATTRLMATGTATTPAAKGCPRGGGTLTARTATLAISTYLAAFAEVLECTRLAGVVDALALMCAGLPGFLAALSALLLDLPAGGATPVGTAGGPPRFRSVATLRSQAAALRIAPRPLRTAAFCSHTTSFEITPYLFATAC